MNIFPLPCKYPTLSNLSNFISFFGKQKEQQIHYIRFILRIIKFDKTKTHTTQNEKERISFFAKFYIFLTKTKIPLHFHILKHISGGGVSKFHAKISFRISSPFHKSHKYTFLQLVSNLKIIEQALEREPNISFENYCFLTFFFGPKYGLFPHKVKTSQPWGSS